MPATDAFARHLATLAVDAAASETARLHIFDTLVAARIGALLDDAGPLPAACDLHSRITRQVALIRSTELDDIEISGLVTPGAVIVPTALLTARALGSDDATVIAAVVAGYEAMIAIARAIDGARALARGIWPTYIAAAIGTAATVARLRGFDTPRMIAALALAAARTAPLAGRVAGPASPRFLLAGLTAAEGVRAAEAAADGFDGDPDLLGELLHLITPGAVLPPIADRPLIEATEIKPYPTARQGFAAIEAFRSLGIGREHAPQIASIAVEVPSSSLAMLATPARGRIGTLVNLGQQLARSMVREGLYDARRLDSLPDDLAELATRIQLNASPEFDEAFPTRWLARVCVTFADGKVLLSGDAPAPAPTGWATLAHKAAAIHRASGFDGTGLDILASDCRLPGRTRLASLCG